MTLEGRIERLERAANATGDYIHMVLVPYVADEAGQADATFPSAPTLQARRDDFEERAAIMEFDGGLTRQEAERLAVLELRSTLH